MVVDDEVVVVACAFFGEACALELFLCSGDDWSVSEPPEPVFVSRIHKKAAAPVKSSFFRNVCRSRTAMTNRMGTVKGRM